MELLDSLQNDTLLGGEKVVFSLYYYTNQRTKLDVLVDYLQANEPEQVIIEWHNLRPYANPMWELNMRSYPIVMHLDSINNWERKMWDIGYQFDCKPDYWLPINQTVSQMEN